MRRSAVGFLIIIASGCGLGGSSSKPQASSAATAASTSSTAAASSTTMPAVTVPTFGTTVGAPTSASTGTAPPPPVPATGGLAVSAMLPNTWRTRAPMPTGRCMFAAAATSKKIYAIGGFSNTTQQALATNEEYDIATDTWRARAPLPNVIYQAGAACLNEKIYVVGGKTPLNGWATDQVWQYDPANDAWTALPPLPPSPTVPTLPNMGAGFAPSYYTGGTYAGRFDVGVVTYQGKLWVIGGAATVMISTPFGPAQSNQGAWQDAYVWDPVTNVWSAGMTAVQCDHNVSVAGAAIVLLDPLHVTTSTGTQPFSLQWSNGGLFADTFTNVYPTNGSEPKIENSVVGLGSRFYVLGGRLDSTGFSQPDAVSFDTTVLPTLSARVLASMGQDRCRFCAVAVPNAGSTGRIFVLGGEKATAVSTPFGPSTTRTDLASVEEYQP